MFHVFLNWKLNYIQHDIDEFFHQFSDEAIAPTKAEIAVFPVVTYASRIAEKYPFMAVGAQDVSEFEKGSYTGEVSAMQFKDIGCKYALIGHSEVRARYPNQTNKVYGRKNELCLKAGVIPVLCVGESMQDRRAKKFLDVIRTQLEPYMEGCMIAYEPVWSIGTGMTPINQDIEDILSFVKYHLSDDVKVLYGGSVSSSNVDELLKIHRLGGLLVGGASLIPREVIRIYHAAKLR